MVKQSVIVTAILVIFAPLIAKIANAVPASFNSSRQITEAVAFDNVLDNPDFDLASIPSNQASFGDSVYILCDSGIFAFNTTGGSDCWGWRASDGTQYAIMGVFSGLAFVNVTTMQVADIVPGPNAGGCSGSYWRDMVTYGQYCYCVSECSGTNAGLMVIDMQYLPDSVHLIGTWDVWPGALLQSHNLSIDTIKGFAYMEAFGNAGFSIAIHNLSTPTNPSFVAGFGIGNGGIHDIFVTNDTAYVAEANNHSFAIYDMANKLSPNLLARVAIPLGGYVHNIWPTEDRRFVVTTEETNWRTSKIWDIQNLGSIQLVGEYLAPAGLAHNAQVKGDTIYYAHYESGITVVDITNPASPSLIGNFDTYGAGEAPNFAGAWGCYPYATDGLVYGSNKDGRLFILHEKRWLIEDSLKGQHTAAQPGDQVRFDIKAVNGVDISRFIIPFDWSGGLNLNFDSFSTVGTRTNYFEQQMLVTYDPFNSRAAVSLIASSSGTSPDLPPGSGVFLSLYFTIPPGASGPPNPISFVTVNGIDPSYINPCLVYEPFVASGSISIGSASCCVGMRGNINGDLFEEIDISDLTYLVAYMFGGGTVPPCLEEANLNGDFQGIIDISDLTYLVSFMFGGGPSPASCF